MSVDQAAPTVDLSAAANRLRGKAAIIVGGGATTVNMGQDFIDRPDSVGRPTPVVEIRIVDENGTDVTAATNGEVWIRGPIVMPGYWGNPGATAETLTPDRWLRTGDVGRLDADGFLYITDRTKDMIIRGGENIYCVEIENRIVEHPDVADAAVIGVPHPALGEIVKALVQVEPGRVLTTESIRSWVAQTLASYKVPELVEIVADQLPRNASGKLLKNVLRGSDVVQLTETM